METAAARSDELLARRKRKQDLREADGFALNSENRGIDEQLPKRERKQDLREADGSPFFGFRTIIYYCVAFLVLLLITAWVVYGTQTKYGGSTTQLFGEYTQNPVSSGNSRTPVVDPSPTYNFRGCAYVTVRPMEDLDPKGGFNWHTIRQNIPRAGKRPSWICPPLLKELYSYMYKVLGFQMGHLVPRANMISLEDQKMTNEVENNIVPIHKNVNMRNMSAVERNYRKLAVKEGELVEYTGWLGELELARGTNMNTIEEIEKIKKHLEQFNGLIFPPKYLYKLVLRRDTYAFVSCAVISNDVKQATHDSTLPKAGPPPEGIGRVAWEDAIRGRTRWLTEKAFFKWCKEKFPGYLTPQIHIERARKFVKSFSTLLAECRIRKQNELAMT